MTYATDLRFSPVIRNSTRAFTFLESLNELHTNLCSMGKESDHFLFQRQADGKKIDSGYLIQRSDIDLRGPQVELFSKNCPSFVRPRFLPD